MNTGIDEDLIRRALDRQAESAVSPERIRAALPSRVARRSRQRRSGTAAVLVAATAAVVAAVSVPVVGLGDRTSDRQARPAGPGASAPVPVTLALRYRPGWLPTGFTERSRSGADGTDWSVSQIWTKERHAELYTGGPRIALSAERAVDGVNPFGDHGAAVEVNGRPGRLVGRPGTHEKSYVHWMPDSSTVLMISQVDYRLSRAELLRIAGSVRASQAVQAAPLRIGWLPAGLVPAPGLAVVGNSATAWKASLHAVPASPDPRFQPPGEDPLSVVFSVGTVTDAPAGGDRITVGDRPARFVTRVPQPGLPLKQQFVVVDLGEGTLLTVSAANSSLSRTDLVRMAENARVDKGADLSWVGRR